MSAAKKEIGALALVNIDIPSGSGEDGKFVHRRCYIMTLLRMTNVRPASNRRAMTGGLPVSATQVCGLPTTVNAVR
jgi:hypothetical protein